MNKKKNELVGKIAYLSANLPYLFCVMQCLNADVLSHETRTML